MFSWGRGTFGRLRTSREDDEVVPTVVAPFIAGRSRTMFVAVAVGAYHSLALPTCRRKFYMRRRSQRGNVRSQSNR
jgi:hypothetical protein